MMRNALCVLPLLRSSPSPREPYLVAGLGPKRAVSVDSTCKCSTMEEHDRRRACTSFPSVDAHARWYTSAYTHRLGKLKAADRSPLCADRPRADKRSLEPTKLAINKPASRSIEQVGMQAEIGIFHAFDEKNQ
jgi:hypothetical protein